jgi:zinc transport system ATP-binding protein
LHKPLAGNIRFGDGVRHNELGYLPQQRDMQKDFPASVYEIVLSGCLNRCGLRPFYNKSEKGLAFENLKKLGAETLAKHCFRELSAGQQQRVLFARALCSARKVILLDEPMAGLDPDTTKDMYELIERINHDDGVTVIMISHDIEAAIRYASHILKIDKASYFYGTKRDYLDDREKEKSIRGRA